MTRCAAHDDPVNDDVYEVHALRHALHEGTASQTYHRFEVYGEPDRPLTTAFWFWVVRNERRTVLLDCGYSAGRARERGRTVLASPAELLGRLGLSPADVDHVVLSHLHWDHVGNVELFPHATFSIAREEFAFWRGPFGHRPCLGLALGDEELASVEALEREGRLFQVEGERHRLYPGIDLAVMPGHTPGQLVAEVATSSGTLVLASDAAHFYESLTLDRPFHAFTDLPGTYRTLQRLRSLAARPGTTVIPGHDPSDAATYPEVAENCFALTASR